jgi:hypothetical protein
MQREFGFDAIFEKDPLNLQLSWFRVSFVIKIGPCHWQIASASWLPELA